MAANTTTSTASILTETVGTVLTITRTPRQGTPPTVSYSVRTQFADHLYTVDSEGARLALLHAGTNPQSSVLTQAQVQALLGAACKRSDGTDTTMAELLGDLWDAAILACTPAENT